MHFERSIVSIQPKQTRLIRAPLLGAKTSSSSEDEPNDTPTSRFVEPYQINAEQHANIRGVLDELNVSDDEGRRLFLLALEYEIGAYQQVVMENLEPIEEPEPVDEGLSEIGIAAKRLSDLLETTSEETRAGILQGMADADIFQRISDQHYLRSLHCEIDRLASACDPGIRPDRQPQGPLNEASRKFIKMLANIYSECFEAKPSADSGQPFSQILQTVVEQTGLRVRYDEDFLVEALGQTESEGG